MLENQDQLFAAWDAGQDFSVSDKVAEGDVFLVKRDDKFYALRTEKIDVTPNDNKDKYTFTVKR